MLILELFRSAPTPSETKPTAPRLWSSCLKVFPSSSRERRLTRFILTIRLFGFLNPATSGPWPRQCYRSSRTRHCARPWLQTVTNTSLAIVGTREERPISNWSIRFLQRHSASRCPPERNDHVLDHVGTHATS